MFPPLMMDTLAAERADDLRRAAAAHRVAARARRARRDARSDGAAPTHGLRALAVRRAVARAAAALPSRTPRVAGGDPACCPA
jgi:hypothetical protein